MRLIQQQLEASQSQASEDRAKHQAELESVKAGVRQQVRSEVDQARQKFEEELRRERSASVERERVSQARVAELEREKAALEAQVCCARAARCRVNRRMCVSARGRV